MKQVLLIFLGGGAGSALRFLISNYLNPTGSQFYTGTFVVNILGCLLLGFILGGSAKNNWLSAEATLLLGAGFCGGFTTFSTFSFEQYALLKSGNASLFLLYAFGSLATGLLAVLAGVWLSRFS